MPPRKLDGFDLLSRLRDGSLLPIADEEQFTKKVMKSYLELGVIARSFDDDREIQGYVITKIGRQLLDHIERHQDTPKPFSEVG